MFTSYIMEVTISKLNRKKKRKTFQLKKVGHKWGEVRKFGKELISNLGDEIFNFKSKEVLLFNILMCKVQQKE